MTDMECAPFLTPLGKARRVGAVPLLAARPELASRTSAQALTLAARKFQGSFHYAAGVPAKNAHLADRCATLPLLNSSLTMLSGFQPEGLRALPVPCETWPRG